MAYLDFQVAFLLVWVIESVNRFHNRDTNKRIPLLWSYTYDNVDPYSSSIGLRGSVLTLISPVFR